LRINQGDLEEQGKQVEMMGSIYRDAEMVFASMSPSVEFNNAAINACFSAIKLLYQELKNIESETELLTLKWISKHKALRTRDEDATIGNLHWRSFRQFQLSEYFRRVWIRQEVCLAQRLIFIYDKSSMDFHEVDEVYGMIYEVARIFSDTTKDISVI
jgi:archaellum component FlaC